MGQFSQKWQKVNFSQPPFWNPLRVSKNRLNLDLIRKLVLKATTNKKDNTVSGLRP
jgi:hypothetical protein